MKLGDLFVKLGLKSQEFDAGMKKAGGSVNTFGGIVKKIGPMITAAFSVAAVYNFFKSSLSLAAEQIKVENELAAALRANGKEVDNNLRRYKTFASQMQRVTTIGDETTLGLLRLAESMQSKAPEEAAKMAIGLSKALGMDLQTATRAAVLAQNGNFMALSRYIPALREATSEVDKFAAVQKTVASGMQIAFAETNTAKGKLEQLRSAWFDVKEEIGRVVLENDALINSLGKLKIQIELLPEYAKLWKASWQWIFGSTVRRQMKQQEKDFDEYVQSILDGLKDLEDAADKTDPPVQKVIQSIKDLTEEKARLISDRNNVDKYNEAEIKGYNDQIAAIDEVIKRLEGLSSKKRELGEVFAQLPRRFGADTDPLIDGGKNPQRMTTYNNGQRSTVTIPAPAIDLTPLKNMDIKGAERVKNIKKWQDEMSLDWASFNAQMSNLIMDFSLDVVEQFGASLGELFATGEWDGKAFGLGILDSIGKFLSTFGSMLVALGVGSEAFQNLIKTGFLGNAGPAIAAGVALMALGAGISAYGRSRGRAGGASAAAPAPGMFNQAANVNPAFAGGGSMGSVFLRGDDLYISGQRNDFKRGQIG